MTSQHGYHKMNPNLTFQNQIASMEKCHSKSIKDNQILLENHLKNFNTELAKERCKIENLQKTLTEKENRISELKTEMELRNSNASPKSKSPITKDSFKETLGRINVLEVEVNRLLELAAVLNNRLESERDQHDETHNALRKERQKAARFETRMLRMEMENKMLNSQVYSKTSSKFSNPTQEDTMAHEAVKNRYASSVIKVVPS